MNSVCYTCSVRASVFFDKDKLNVDERTCRDVISECSSSWIRMTQYLDYINKFNAILSQLEKKTGIKFSEAIAGKPAKAIHDWADKNHFRQKLRDCQDGACDFSTAKDICENFFSINNPIYIRQALVVENNIMNREQYVFESLRNKDLNTQTKTRTFSELTNKQLEFARKNDKMVVSKAEKFVRMFEEKDQSLSTGRTLVLGTIFRRTLPKRAQPQQLFRAPQFTNRPCRRPPRTLWSVLRKDPATPTNPSWQLHNAPSSLSAPILPQIIVESKITIMLILC